MKPFNYLKYAMRDAFRAVFRHKGMVAIATGTVLLTLVLFGTLILMGLNTHHIAKNFENDIEMNVFMKTDATEEQEEALEKLFPKLEGLEKFEYVDKEQAMSELSHKFGSESAIIDSMGTENPLPSAFRLTFTDVSYMKDAAATLEKAEGIDEIVYGDDLVENVLSFNRTFSIISGIFIVVMIGIVMALINSTIRLTVLNRREEIVIMKRIGAVNSYINMPFFLEGILIGVLGALLADGILYYGYGQVLTYLRESLPFITLLDRSYVALPVGLGLLIFGGILGAGAASIAVKKYLKAI